MNISALVGTAACLLLLLAVGYLARKLGLIDDTLAKGLSQLIIKVGQPALIINSLIRTGYDTERLKDALVVLGIGFALQIFVAIYAYVSCRPIRDVNERKLSEFSMIFTNCGFFGFPILAAVMGETGLFWGAFYLISFFILHWTWGVLILVRGRADIRPSPKKIFFNAGTIPCFVGLAIYLLRVPVPGFILDFSAYLANICTPISMLITGALLATIPVKQLFCTWRLYALCLQKLLLIPVLVCVIMSLCRVPVAYTIFATIMAAMPTASVVTIFGRLYDIKPAYAAMTVGLTTLFSVATLPFVLWVAEHVLG